MNLTKSAKLICELRKKCGMTQKQVADILGIEPKTVSKWENGRGFPDVSCVAELAEIFGVSEKALLTGELNQNGEEVGNMRKTAFYVCPHCASLCRVRVNSWRIVAARCCIRREDMRFLIYEFLNDKDIGKYFANSDEISAFEHINFALAALQRKSTD